MVRVSGVLVNYERAAEGVTAPPQISWSLGSDRRGAIQKSYRLQIARNGAFGRCDWDSGEVVSRDSSGVVPDGLQLASAARYGVRVAVWAADGDESGWSDPAFFTTALLAADGWKAPFVSAETEADSDRDRGTYLRGGFAVRGAVREAFAFTTGLGVYHFYLNGQKVGSDQLAPGWTSYNKHLLYQTYDVTGLLLPGENCAGAHLGSGWYKGEVGFKRYRNHYGKRTAFLMQLIIRYEGGGEEVVCTGTGWKGCDSPVVHSDIYDGETYDARLEQPGWNCAGFDDTAWRPVQVADFDQTALVAQSSCRVREIDRLPVREIIRTPQGDTVLDFGQNLTGRVHLSVHGRPGEQAVLQFFEVLDKDGNVYLDNLRTAKQTLRYTCGGARESYAPLFTFMGFRYAKVVAWPGEIAPADVTAWSMHSDMERTGRFRCSDEAVNRLHENILWGMKGNFLDVPTDCPQRDERLGWTGDAQIFCRTASYLMNTYQFFRKWLGDVEADQTPEGGVPHVVPDILSGRVDDDWLCSQGTHSAAAWADVAVILPWSMYLTFGDKAILREKYRSMKSWIDFMKTHARGNIWNYKLQFGDWVALDAEEGSYFGATPNDLTCTAYYAYSTGLFAQIAGILGEEEDRAAYTALYESVRDTFRRTFFDREGNMAAQTQTAHIIALYFGLVEERHRKKTAQALLRLLERENGHLVTGFVGTPYFCHALSENGQADAAYGLLLKDDFPSWLYQVKMGATTVWEHWDGIKPDGSMWSADMNSFNHYAYGAIAEWLYRVAAGLEVGWQGAGFAHAVIQPHISHTLTWVEAEFQSVRGVLRSRWERREDTVTVSFSIPANTTATVRLDRAAEILDADGLGFRCREGCFAADAGSGSYRVRYRMA